MADYKTPRGTQDILPAETRKWNEVEELIRSVCYYYGYDEIRTPIFEDTKVFKRENDSSDMVNKEMYTFSIHQEDSLTLRPEGTAGVIRSFVQHKMFGNMEMPAKLYYMGEMFRYERPQKGRYRQFNQFGVENIGVKSPLVDAEIIALGYSIVKALGLSQIKVIVNTLGDDESRKNYREKLKEHFKDSVADLCGDCQRRYEQNPLRLLDCKIDKDHPSMLNVPRMHDSLTEESKEYFQEVLQALDALEIPYEIDDRLVRGLDYYTHTVFEVVSTHPESGSQATVFAGGRYDGLVEYFHGPQMSGVGFAMGLERLMILAEAEGIELGKQDGIDVYVMALGNVGTKPLEIATACRANGFVSEFNILPRSLKAQFKSVDRKQAKVVVIVGEEELKDHKVNVKCVATQTQVTVDLDKVVETVEEMLEKEGE
ncbi:MAG: histidine--tRNA ligase [Erysipelotrichaceae bacterium]|nr:histidine--tRNA ligase [Erysipelotrichaceae bacterium]